jgi:peptidoglycan/xylan/chitin deacetylase (PgdA/CDA1 family)
MALPILCIRRCDESRGLFARVVITMTAWMRPGRLLVLVASAAVAAGMMTGTPLTSPGPALAAGTYHARQVPQGLGGKVWDVIPTRAKVVALTFDAGGNADGASSILATLRAQHVAASFNLTGNFVSAYPAQAKAMAAAGRLGDHTITHPHFLLDHYTDAQIRQEVLGAQQMIKSVTGVDPAPWFRFPYGEYNAHTLAVVNAAGFVPVGWTVDTLGWKGTSGGQSVQTVLSRVLASLQPGEIVLMHCGSGGTDPNDRSTLDADALPTVISALKARGYQFVTIDALQGLGYHLLTSDGGAHNFGAPWYGSMGGKLPAGVTAVGITADPATGGYWILKSNGGVNEFNAPWYGSMGNQLPAGQSVTGIAGTPGGGYLILTSNGGVHPFHATWYGSMGGKLPAGVTAVGITADPATGGYWILKSNGGVNEFNAPWYGSLANQLPAGQSVTGIAAE